MEVIDIRKSTTYSRQNGYDIIKNNCCFFLYEMLLLSQEKET